MEFTEVNNSVVSRVVTAVVKQVQKWGTLAGMLLLCAMTVSSIILGLTFGADRLPSPWAYNVGADVLGTMMCTLLYYGCFNREEGEDESGRLFMALLACNACTLFLDQVTWTLEGVPSLRVLYIVVYVALLCVLQLENYQFWRYIRAYLALEGKLVQRCDLVIRAALVPMLLVCLANLFVPICFYVDEQGVAYETAAYAVSLLYVPVVGVCSTLCLLRAKISVKNKIVIALFYVVPMIFAVFYGSSSDATPPDAPLFAITLMYMVLVAERSRKLASTAAELSMATSIQANMLPNVFPAFPKRSEFDLYATMDPAKEVGGDFYDFFLIDDDRLALVMADVSGKGVPAALFMMISRTLIKTQAQMQPDPARVLTEVNAMLTENNKEGMFVTVWLGILRISTGELTYTDAGHEKLLLYQDGAWRFLPKWPSMAVAVLPPDEFNDLPESYHYHNETIRLKPGDMIFQYTDGVTEAANAQDKLFGEERLLESMNAAGGMAPDELLPQIRRSIDAFVGAEEQFDDITMLALRYQGSGADRS